MSEHEDDSWKFDALLGVAASRVLGAAKDPYMALYALLLHVSEQQEVDIEQIFEGYMEWAADKGGA